MKTLGIALANLLLAAPLTLAQTPPCPVTTLTCGTTPQTLPGDQGSPSCPVSPDGSASAAFNYSQGTSRIDFFGMRVALSEEDTFWFEGPIPGELVNAKAVLILNGQACEGDVASFHADFEMSSTQSFNLSAPVSGGCRSGSQALTQDLTLVVGAPIAFRLNLDSNPGAGGSGFLAVVLHFEQLPPNVRVRSCHGHRQDGPVPALARSWGSVKSIYRGDR